MPRPKLLEVPVKLLLTQKQLRRARRVAAQGGVTLATLASIQVSSFDSFDTAITADMRGDYGAELARSVASASQLKGI